jgi:hypothetical protein
MNMRISQFFLPIMSIFLLVSCGGESSSNSQVDNNAPSISGALATIRVGESLNFKPQATDIDGDTLTYSIQGQPSWLSLDKQTGAITGSPTSSDLGSVSSITISVSDGKLSSTTTFDLTVIKPIFLLGFEVSNLDQYRDMELEVTSCFMAATDQACSISDETVTINDSSIINMTLGIEAGSQFEVKIERDAGRQDCTLETSEGVMGYADEIISIDCQPDASAALFSLDKMHKIRLSMDHNEWQRFVLDTERASYKVGDANDRISVWTSWTHSEVYRQVDFEYLDSNDQVIESLNNVGFKMRGNTSRQWPEYGFMQTDGTASVKPRRFSFGLKFDEEFDEDEGVYSCIDGSGQSAAVAGHPCQYRLGKDLEEVPENDGREFMDVEKLYFRFNRDDPSYQRELLAHDVLNSIGVPTSRVAHANVELVITGVGDLYGRPLPQTYNMGVFQMVEQIDKPFVKRLFGKNGFLFKVGALGDLAGPEEADINCIAYEDSIQYINPSFCNIGVEKSDPDSREEWLGTDNYLNPVFVNSDINEMGGEVSQFRPYRPIYDLKTKKKSIVEGRALLQDFIQFVQSNPSASSLSERFDISGFIKAQAAEIVMGAVDHYVRVGNNYYLYLNPTTERWTYIVTDFDFVFRDNHDMTNGSIEGLEAFRDVMESYALPSPGKVSWAGRVAGAVDPILWDIVFSEQTNKDILYTEIRSILDQVLNWDLVNNKLSFRNGLVQAAIEAMDAGLNDGCKWIYNPAAIDAPAETELCDANDVSIKAFIEARSATLFQELEENGF